MKELAPGLNEKLFALGLRPLPLGCPRCNKVAGLAGAAGGTSSHESPIMETALR